MAENFSISITEGLPADFIEAKIQEQPELAGILLRICGAVHGFCLESSRYLAAGFGQKNNLQNAGNMYTICALKRYSMKPHAVT